MPESTTPEAIETTAPDVDVTEVAMSIIISSGDARKQIFEAGDAAADGDFSRATALLDSAHKDLQTAHRVHTDRIQAEAGGETMPYSLLFAHAQDTLMTANSEYRVVRKTLGVLERLEARVARLEAESQR